MSQAHRPTWAPAMGRETKAGSSTFRQVDYSARTKLKFRQPGQTSSGDVAKRDLKMELMRAEREAQNKKRKEKGLPLLPEIAAERPLAIEGSKQEETEEDEAARKRRKILEEVAAMDADDSDDSEEDDEDGDQATTSRDKGKGRADDGDRGAGSDDDDDSDSDDSDDEDDTAALMAELNKIKRERQEEKERQEREAAEANAVDREAEIAMGNPLLNLQAALGKTPAGGSGSSVAGSSVTGSFAVKRRWDDDLIFKNQAVGVDDKPKKEFVNDLLRTEFHRKFMAKFVR